MPPFDAQTWIFDCDGVILDSNEMKTQGFGEVLSDYPAEVVEPFLAFQKTAFGMSRFWIFDQFFERFLMRKPREGERQSLLDAFSSYCSQSYPRQRVTPGTLDLLDELAARGTHLYVASGSEQTELNTALKVIGLADRFRMILGSPVAKKNNIAAIMSQSNVSLGAVFLGDARTDFEAARENGLPFIYVAGFSADQASMDQLCLEQRFPRVDTLGDILALLPPSSPKS